jgi:CelD/BcsL family acetyltransferase involved in cellulose biosynthesis
MALTATFTPLPAMPALGERWRALEARGEGSFFLGWTWMESWLGATGVKPELLAIGSEGRDVALALVGCRFAPRLLGPVASLWLNQAGTQRADRPFIEYNGLLVARDAPENVTAVAMEALLARNDWRVLRLSGMEPDAPLASEGRFRRRLRTATAPAYYVGLDAVRHAGGDYLSLLSGNTRSQIRRAAKDYGADEAVVTVAGPEAFAPWLAEMQALNIGRHADNAWEEPMFRDFVRALLANGASKGEVELLRIEKGGHLLGLLLNFVYRGRAMNYQSAFAQPLGAKGKPGLLCHAAAIDRYAGMGLDIYSLLAGSDRYKQSLSTGAEALEWWSLERFSPRLEAEAWIRRLLRRPADV